MAVLADRIEQYIKERWKPVREQSESGVINWPKIHVFLHR